MSHSGSAVPTLMTLEEAPETKPSGPANPNSSLFPESRARWSGYGPISHTSSRKSGTELADVAFTLQEGRKAFEHRRMAVCRDALQRLAFAVPTPLRYSPLSQHAAASRCFLLPGFRTNTWIWAAAI